MEIEIIILLILIVLNAFFAASEIALISLNDNKVKLMADKGDRKSIMLYQLLSEPSRFLATIQIGITLAGFLASAFAAESFAGRFTQWLIVLGVPGSPRVLEAASVIIITLILSYFTLVFGELVPKRLALQKAESISMFAVVPLTLLSKISSPFVKLLTFSTNSVVRLFGVDPSADDENVTEEEIRMMIDVGKEKGTIQENEKIMINNIFEFDDKQVSDIMTHRTNIVAIPAHFSLKETIDLVNLERYTRFPVYQDSLDHIIGILHVKDLLQFANKDHQAFNLLELIREPYYVPDSKGIDELFKEMQKHNTHLAIAIDEYGGTDGLVTIEDVLEEIVGNIFDEYDEPELETEKIKVIDENTYLIDGTTHLDDVTEALKLDLPIEDYDTLSGFVLGELGYIPNSDERPVTEYNNVLFAVEEMDEKRITQIRVSVRETELQM
ncbi:putative hemolysin [Bacillus mesophilus]|uniref:HlyC/CorC family transporter n=1 Tax=Bacillus mesophilus TaxID=1808955 RepID=A0A6M0Q4E8_9BACI|nr:hemolysin family protein [Bacillus mesophilus]MBM7661208.1 putative hemolysin [Bacillus mesophilus]NEY71267.1 HlyC/CorC family transporter [Bacillus mesophilus]